MGIVLNECTIYRELPVALGECDMVEPGEEVLEGDDAGEEKDADEEHGAVLGDAFPVLARGCAEVEEAKEEKYHEACPDDVFDIGEMCGFLLVEDGWHVSVVNEVAEEFLCWLVRVRVVKELIGEGGVSNQNGEAEE